MQIFHSTQTKGRRWALLLACLAGLTLLSASLQAQTRTEIHLEGESAAAGHFFLTYQLPEGESGYGLIAAGTGHGGEELTTYGIWKSGGEDEVGLVSPDKVGEWAHGEGDTTGSLMATLNAEQLAAVKEVLAAAPNESLEHGKSAAFENVVYRALSKIPVKAPFRGNFAVGDPYQLLRDVVRINSKK